MNMTSQKDMKAHHSRALNTSDSSQRKDQLKLEKPLSSRRRREKGGARAAADGIAMMDAVNDVRSLGKN